MSSYRIRIIICLLVVIFIAVYILSDANEVTGSNYSYTFNNISIKTSAYDENINHDMLSKKMTFENKKRQSFIDKSSHNKWSIYKRVEISNREGHILRFDSFNGVIRCWFILNRAHTFAFSDVMPRYRIDDNKTQVIKKGHDDFSQLEVSANRWVRWHISQSHELSENLLQFMNAEEVAFQYYPDGTQVKETVFALENARQAIYEILPQGFES